MNEVYNVDCMEYMKDLPEKYFDLAICDPPYGIGKTWTKRKRIYKETGYKNDRIPTKRYFEEIKRVSKNYIIWGANYYICLWPSKNLIIWDKIGNHLTDFKSEVEIAVTSISKYPAIVYRQQWSGGRKGIDTGIKTIHPHQKPVALYRWLLQKCAKEGQTIFDSHVGSGSSRIACYELGYDFRGCEIDKECWAAQEERFGYEKARIDNVFYLPEEENLLFKGERGEL